MLTFTQPEVTSFYLNEAALSSVGFELLGDLLNELPVQKSDPELLTLYLTGGLPGSGKGSIVRDIDRLNPGLVVVDPDAVKLRLVADLARRFPELAATIASCREWADVVHKASEAIARAYCLAVIGQGRSDVLYDSTMANKAKEWLPVLAGAAREQDYSIYVYVCSTKVEECIKRASQRASSSIQLPNGLVLSGRTVPIEVIRTADQTLDRNLIHFQQIALYDYCEYIYPQGGRLRSLSSHWLKKTREEVAP